MYGVLVIEAGMALQTAKAAEEAPYALWHLIYGVLVIEAGMAWQTAKATDEAPKIRDRATGATPRGLGRARFGHGLLESSTGARAAVFIARRHL